MAQHGVFSAEAGSGVQSGHHRYRHDRGILVTELGGELSWKGVQVFASFRF